ncbi:MAG: peptidyl-prolyl cis-trans isomerase, partial [Bacteroidia bacterium]|nr:peptidyl-prolyl cis-trans isomerase [Bacteroidia bacterium]
SYAIENSRADFKYVKIPFDQIDGSGIELNDNDFKNYLEENRDEFETETETRTLDYLAFDVIPTTEDSNSIRSRMEELNKEFAITDNDSVFTTVNNGAYTHLYAPFESIPADLQDGIAALEIGEIYGPVVSNDYYVSAKLLGKQLVPDSVTARHILIRADRNNKISLDAAMTLIDSLKRELRSGTSFDSLAIKHSADTQSGLQGGDLGTFPQEMMVPEFAQACFIDGKKRGLYTVTTQFGVHLIEVQDQIFNNKDPKYKVASIGLVIKPSQETQDNKYDEVAEVVAEARNIDELKTAISNLDNASIESSEALDINDFSLGNLGSGQSSREIVKWAFDPSVEAGDVSPEVYRYTDKVNYYDNKYVIISLKSIDKPGLPPVDAVRSDIETAVLNAKKGEQLKNSLQVSTLDDLASQYNVTVETASDIAMNNRFIPGMGNEPDVIGAAFRLDAQAISQPIVGNSGVYVIQPLSKQEAGVPTNIPFLKNSVSTATRSQVTFKLIDNMKKRAEVMDDRYKFF